MSTTAIMTRPVPPLDRFRGIAPSRPWCLQRDSIAANQVIPLLMFSRGVATAPFGEVMSKMNRK
jgi:hypothetical protein